MGMSQSSQQVKLWAVWMVIAPEDGSLTVCTELAVFKGLTLWLPTSKCQNWLMCHRPLCGQAMWQDPWEVGQEKDITIYHVTGHSPLVTPGNDEAGALSCVQWLEKHPASDVAYWLPT